MQSIGNIDSVMVDLFIDFVQKFVEYKEVEDIFEDGSDVFVKIFFFFDVLLIYLFKNLFFNCIEENKKDLIGKIVIIGEIFSKLFKLLSEFCLIFYFFIFS